MYSLSGKKILILGSTAPCVHVTRFAKEMGATVYVTDNLSNPGPAKQIADVSLQISTNDFDSLLSFINSEEIDCVMTGPGEFNIVNAITISEMAGLRFYCSKEQWNTCQDKRSFKDFCKRYGLPIVPEYSVDDVLRDDDYPVIVKPVDSCSSRGISICYNQEEYKAAKINAYLFSESKKILVEKYIDNGGETIDAKYVAIDGRFYLEAIGDRHVLDGGLITSISFYPSRFRKAFIEQVDPYVAKAFTALGIKNGAFFFQAISDGDSIFIYEMGLRVSGGMIYNMTEATCGNNTLKMLIHYGATGLMCENSDIQKIDAGFNGKVASTMAFPLRLGKISSVIGFDAIKCFPGVIDLTLYYHKGDVIIPKYINTLDQLFARVMVCANNRSELNQLLARIRQSVSVLDTEGNEMIIWSTVDSLLS